MPGLDGITVQLRRSARARRISLRVGRSDGRVTLTLPQGMSERQASAFVRDQAAWVRRAVAAVPARRVVRVGGSVPLLGRDVPVVAGSGRAARHLGATIAVADDVQAGRRVQALLLSLARTHLAAAVDRHAETVGRPPAKLSLRDTRSRWGSCSSRGALMFSWRLVMAPPEVLDYVAAHEVAHLLHMDHSPRFWTAVERLVPDYAVHRAWLRTDGAALHAIDFAGG
ncbi:M48 family metallopeptidase [uncultured Jannaschia sp.]|uniref:M48 family metallopeptidase n=1 Tax=uncultured Jannaschia sp. TaxID=293347 RepID=UPI00260EB3D6|nr:SprT family zinc-dependent metalloprotease [uncultured Jannaschia sp.]